MLIQRRLMPLWLLWPVLYILCTAGAFMTLASWDRGPVGDDQIGDLPVLIITPAGDGDYNADIIYFSKVHYDVMPDAYTFLIPVGQEMEVNRKLAKQITVPGNVREAEVEYLADGRQRIKVTRSGNMRRTTVWYVASDKQIVPEYVVYYFPFAWFLLAVPIGFAVSTIVAAIIYCIRYFIRRVRQAHG